MNFHRRKALREALSVALFFAFSIISLPLFALDTNEIAVQLRRLEEQNRLLQDQLREQNETIKRLNQRMVELEKAGDHEAAISETADSSTKTTPGFLTRALSSDRIMLSGEGGIGFFAQGNQGQFRHDPFRVDEAKLFLDAKVWEDVYLFAEGNLFYREQYEDHPDVGELYVDFENVSKFWGVDRLLNVRLGRIDIPFGEEYLVRDAIDNPLISHSLSDIWGVDEGLELYGRWKRFQYVVAVQNGGHPMLNDGDSDKAVVAKVGFNPNDWLHLSVSGMRTGNLDVKNDELSEMWFANGFARALGSPATTTKFHANLAEGDAQFFWRKTALKTAGGAFFFDDNDTSANNSRDVEYYYVEAVQNLTEKLYLAARWSQIFANDGYPLVGAGEFGPRFYGSFTEDLSRLTLGGGYRWSRDVVSKLEYSLNRGHELGGKKRDQEDFFGAELSVRF